MNANQSVDQQESKAQAISGIDWKAASRFGIYLLLLPTALFVAAGRLDWVMGWIYG